MLLAQLIVLIFEVFLLPFRVPFNIFVFFKYKESKFKLEDIYPLTAKLIEKENETY